MRLLKKLNTEKLTRVLVGIAFIGILALIVVGFMYYWYFSGSVSSSQELWGQFGDYLGGTLSPIFSFLALIALLLTIILQNNELQLSREEMKNSVAELQEQNKTLASQKNENTFFQLMEFHNSIVDALYIETVRPSNLTFRKPAFATEVKKNYKQESGREVFKVLYGRLKLFAEEYSKELSITEGSDPDVSRLDIQDISSAFERFYEKNESYIGHYFKSLLTIISFLDEGFQDKSFFLNVIRSQLSNYEQLLLFYFLISDAAEKTFVQHAIRYNLLKGLNQSLLLDEKHLEYIDQRALGIWQAVAEESLN